MYILDQDQPDLGIMDVTTNLLMVRVYKLLYMFLIFFDINVSDYYNENYYEAKTLALTFLNINYLYILFNMMRNLFC